MRIRLIVAGLLAAMLAPRVADAQPAPMSRDLPITTISKTAYGNQATASQKVIQNEADYRAYFGGTPPATPAVDFTKEDVLAVSMGTKPSSGYATEITRVELMTGGFTGGMAFVTYKETSPPPGAITLTVLTSPVHVIKVEKGAYRYVFTNAAPQPAATFTSLSLVFNRPIDQYTYTLSLQADGKARLEQASPTARYFPIDAAATATELQKIKDAFAQAKVETLPKTIPDPRLFIVAPENITLTSTVGTQSYVTGANVGYYTPYDGFGTLVNALMGLANRLKTSPPPASFERIVLSSVGGLAPYSETITLSKDGAVTINRTGTFGPAPNPSFFTGQAKADELTKAKDAFLRADVATLPAKIDDPVLIMDIPSNVLESRIGTTDYKTTIVMAGFYGSYKDRVKPLVDVIRGIADRVVREVEGEEIQGWVALAPGGLKLGPYIVAPTSPLRDLVFAARGRYVVAKARIADQGGISTATLISVQGETNRFAAVRRYPAWWSSYFAVARPGEGFPIKGQSTDGRYLKVTFNGSTGWIFRAYVTVGSSVQPMPVPGTP